jgi:hypothetical protein
MRQSIESLLEARELGLETKPFYISENQVFLEVKDEEEEDFSIILAGFKVDFNDKQKSMIGTIYQSMIGVMPYRKLAKY